LGCKMAVFILLFGVHLPGNPAAPVLDEASSLPGTKWKLKSYGHPDAPTPVIEGSTVTLIFEEAGQVGGSGGCHGYGGRYQVEKSAIRFKEIMSTLMACADERVTQQEGVYLRALESAISFELSPDTLTISYDEGRSLLCFGRL
jgi:heat shock protein HslJ